MASAKVLMRGSGQKYAFDRDKKNKLLAHCKRSSQSIAMICGFGGNTLKNSAYRGYIYENHLESLEFHFKGAKDIVCKDAKLEVRVRSIDEYTTEELQAIIAKRTVFARYAANVQKSLDILLKQDGFTIEMYQYVVEGALNGLKKFMEEQR